MLPKIYGADYQFAEDKVAIIKLTIKEAKGMLYPAVEYSIWHILPKHINKGETIKTRKEELAFLPVGATASVFAIQQAKTLVTQWLRKDRQELQ